MSLIQFIFAAAVINVLFAVSLVLLYTVVDHATTLHLVGLIVGAAILNISLAGYFIYTQFILEPDTLAADAVSQDPDDIAVVQLSHTPVWLQYTPLMLTQKLSGADPVWGYNNLNPTLQITEQEICYRVLRHTCRPITDIVDIRLSTVSLESHLNLIRYAITFQAGDILHITIRTQNRELFESTIARSGLLISNSTQP